MEEEEETTPSGGVAKVPPPSGMLGEGGSWAVDATGEKKGGGWVVESPE